MKGCLEVDALVGLGAALDWRLEEGLEHLRECVHCRRRLERLGELSGTLGATIEPRPGFEERVIASLFRPGGAGQVRLRRAWLAALLNPALAGLTAFFAIALAGGELPASALDLPALLACVTVAGVTFWWNHAQRSAATSPG